MVQLQQQMIHTFSVQPWRLYVWVFNFGAHHKARKRHGYIPEVPDTSTYKIEVHTIKHLKTWEKKIQLENSPQKNFNIGVKIELPFWSQNELRNKGNITQKKPGKTGTNNSLQIGKSHVLN